MLEGRRIRRAGRAAQRAPIKRRSDDPSISVEGMLVEDVAHMLKKWTELKKQCKAQQPELPRICGCIDTRWENTAHALRAIIGLTAVLERLTGCGPQS